MIQVDDQENINKLEKKLYNKDYNVKEVRTQVTPDSYDVKKSWNDEKSPKSEEKTYNISPMLRKIFIASVVFFVLASIIAFYRIFISPNLVSSKNIEILIQGPVSIDGGDELSFQVLITNKNNVPLKSSELIIEFPKGTRKSDTLEELSRERINIGPLSPNDPVTETIKVILFGEENTVRDILFKLEYRAEGSSGTFIKEKIYSVGISNSPTTLSVFIPPEVNSGQRLIIPINVKSNSNSIIEDFMIEVEYPFGFEYESSNPKPAYDNNIWYFGDLSPEGEIEIKIIGTITGQVSGQRSFKINAGVQDEDDTRSFLVIYNALTEIVDIERPFVGIDFLVNGSQEQEVSVTSGNNVTGEIRWTNNLPSKILNGEIEIKLEGAILNEESVTATKGFYRSLDNTLIWNQTTDRTLETLEPGEKGTIRFSFAPFSLLGQEGATYRKPTIYLKVKFNGTRVSEGFSGDPIEITTEKEVKVNTEAQLASYGLFHSGAFINTGSLPPRVDQETTYTIVWSITNSSNNINNAKVTASIPTYVRWVGAIAPANESVSYDDTTGEVVWNVGSVSAGVGLTSTAKQMSFQIAITPSISQVGESPKLISEALLEGTDSFTNTQIKNSKTSIDTYLRNDPDFGGQQDGRVVN